MNYNHRFMIVAAIICSSFTSGAQQVYESVDKQGVVEYSDELSPGAKEIVVKPNVVDVTPVKPLEDSPQGSSSEEVQGSAGPAVNAPTEVIQDGKSETAYERERREQREENVEQPLRRKETTHLGVHKQ
jgi:hypothetical protein